MCTCQHFPDSHNTISCHKAIHLKTGTETDTQTNTKTNGPISTQTGEYLDKGMPTFARICAENLLSLFLITTSVIRLQATISCRFSGGHPYLAVAVVVMLQAYLPRLTPASVGWIQSVCGQERLGFLAVGSAVQEFRS